jgi:predicted adenine nucleotide alpha hydrolase (AANH) superfamily ATPase
MLVHICCSVDSHYFLQRLQHDLPSEELVGFFYDPNIHPYSEYQLRLLDVQRSCDMLGIELIEGEYDYEEWMQSVRGLEFEPEKGSRCSVCFDNRLERTAQKAKELDHATYTTTLLTSPKKSIKQLEQSGQKLNDRYGVEFFSVDYRTNNGTQQQNILAKEDKLYRQNYCGCIHGVTIQREQQERLLDEMMSPISHQILPGSIDERLEMYKKRMDLEVNQTPYHILKTKFLNYRLLFVKLFVKKVLTPCYVVSYSLTNRDKVVGRVEHTIDHVGYLNRDEIRFIALDTYNNIMKTDFQSLTELNFSPPSFHQERRLRDTIDHDQITLNAIIVVDKIPTEKIELYLNAKTYQDTKEVIKY